MIKMTTRELWLALTPAEKDDACLALWEGTDSFSRDAQPKVLRELAAALKFREAFLKRVKPVEKARHLRRLVDTPTLRHLCDDVFRSWLVVRKTPMLVCFVEAQGMAHAAGIIDDSVKSPDAATLRKGVRAVRDQFPPRDVALYMGVMLAAGGDFWEGLPEAVESEVPGFKQSLGLEH
jgi:hypothetical protein